MVSESISITKQVFTFLETHQNETCRAVQSVFNQHDKGAVKSAYYRWRARRQKDRNSKRPDTVSKNHATHSKRKPTPSNLSKIDEVAYEAYLLALIDFDEPNINIAREIRSYLDQKKAIAIAKPKEDKTKEQSDNDFRMIMDGSKDYISGVKQQGSS